MCKLFSNKSGVARPLTPRHSSSIQTSKIVFFYGVKTFIPHKSNISDGMGIFCRFYRKKHALFIILCLHLRYKRENNTKTNQT